MYFLCIKDEKYRKKYVGFHPKSQTREKKFNLYETSQKLLEQFFILCHLLSQHLCNIICIHFSEVFSLLPIWQKGKGLLPSTLFLNWIHLFHIFFLILFEKNDFHNFEKKNLEEISGYSDIRT